MNEAKLDQILIAVNRIGLQYVDMRDQFQALAESVSDMQQHVRHIPAMRRDIAVLKQDVSTIKLHCAVLI